MEEYIAFVKNFIVNRCITEFTLVTYDSNIDIIDSMYDMSIWDKVFQKLSPIMKYYSTLATHNQDRLATVYEYPTFQEYVDKKISVNTISPIDYQTFMVNMKNEGFRKNVVKKYTDDCSKNTIKNHFIYLTNLYFMKEVGGHTYFTSEEEDDMVKVINAIPYFKYVAKAVGNTSQFEEQAHAYIQKYLFR